MAPAALRLARKLQFAVGHAEFGNRVDPDDAAEAALAEKWSFNLKTRLAFLGRL
jgi:hypothetical protein